MWKYKQVVRCSKCKRNEHKQCASPNCMCPECASTVESQREQVLRQLNEPQRWKPEYRTKWDKYTPQGRAKKGNYEGFEDHDIFQQ